jgi:extracellular matrix regulatory protein A
VRLVNIGYGNVVVAERVVAVISPESAPMKRFKEEARKAGRLIDGTQGRRTRSILITDSHHIVLSALQTETVAERLERGASAGAPSQPTAAPALPVEDAAEPEGAEAAEADAQEADGEGGEGGEADGEGAEAEADADADTEEPSS